MVLSREIKVGCGDFTIFPPIFSRETRVCKIDIYAEYFFVFSMLLLHGCFTQNCSHKHVVHLMTLGFEYSTFSRESANRSYFANSYFMMIRNKDSKT